VKVEIENPDSQEINLRNMKPGQIGWWNLNGRDILVIRGVSTVMSLNYPTETWERSVLDTEGTVTLLPVGSKVVITVE
jgi:hypothetical protein